jgi:hypothetical protein
MRHKNSLRFALLATIILCSGCMSKNKGKIEGTSWSSMAASVKGISVPPGAAKLEFGVNGKLIYVTPIQTFTGTYSLGMGDYVTLNLDQELAGRKSHAEHVNIIGNQLTMRDSDGTEVVFNKTR